MERFAVKKSLDLGNRHMDCHERPAAPTQHQIDQSNLPSPSEVILLLMNSHFKSIKMLRFKFFILSSYHVSPAEKKFEIWQFFVYFNAQDGV